MSESEQPQLPIPMRLNCPSCGELHIDEGPFETKPHHTHACQSCGNHWRPAMVYTVGVKFLPGCKKKDDEVGKLRAETSWTSLIKKTSWPERFAQFLMTEIPPIEGLNEMENREVEHLAWLFDETKELIRQCYNAIISENLPFDSAQLATRIMMRGGDATIASELDASRKFAWDFRRLQRAILKSGNKLMNASRESR